MAIRHSATATGLEANTIRPGAAAVRTQIQALADDQAFAWESLVDLVVPDGGSQLATGHIHDGTTGAQIRIPLAQGRLNANLAPRDLAWAAAADDDDPGYFPFVFTPVFVPAGVTSILIWVTVNSPVTAETLTASTYSASIVRQTVYVQPQVAGPENFPWLNSGRPGIHVVFWRFAVNPGAINFVRIEAWDGHTMPGTDREDGAKIPLQRRVTDWGCGDLKEPNPYPMEYRDPAGSSQLTTADIDLPANFSPMDDAVLPVDGAFSAWHSVFAVKNLAMLAEVCTGKAAGLLPQSAASFTGHTHGAGTARNDSGADIDACLGAWAYGTIREPTNGAAGYANVHTADGSANVWSGRIIAPTAKASTTKFELVQHRVRLPRGTDANLGITGSTTKIKVAVLLWSLNKADPEVFATLALNSGATPGTEKSDATPVVAGPGLSAGEYQLYVIDNVEASPSASGDGDIAQLSISIQAPSSVSGNYVILGACAYWEA